MELFFLLVLGETDRGRSDALAHTIIILWPLWPPVVPLQLPLDAIKVALLQAPFQ